MLALRVVQAEFGDCLVLEVASDPRRYILIDGGPELIYDRHLKQVLRKIADDGGKLDRVVLSHVDGDHIVGLIDLFADLRNDAYIGVDGLWMNTFTGSPEGAGLEPQLRTLGAQAPATMAAAAVQTIGEGNDLTLLSLQLQVPINEGFVDRLVLVDTTPDPIPFGDVEVRIVGPTRANLDALREKWIAWLERHASSIGTGDPFVMANSDISVPNLSSIMLYIRHGDETMLLTGDGRSDHLLDGLEAAGLLDENGRIHVTLLKLPHHGSNRNATRKFFEKVTADKYVVSANGKDDNPDLSTLIWLVEAAQKAGRHVTIYATNETLSTAKLQQEYPAAEYGYTLKFPAPGRSSMLVEL